MVAGVCYGAIAAAVMIFPNRSLAPSNPILHQALLNSLSIKRIYLDKLSPEQAVASVGMQLTILPKPQMAQAKEVITRVQPPRPTSCLQTRSKR